MSSTQLPSSPSLPSKADRSILFENRLLAHSKNSNTFCRSLPRDLINREYIDQLNRSVCSIGANYIEANESESRRDFFHRIKICKKEAKESIYWLKIIIHSLPEFTKTAEKLIQESEELVKIFSAILKKNGGNDK